ncbi:MAG: ferrochelatase [Bacteroidales bacterium]|nr:ferrochelatase [Bacteroidales bacterium]
MSKPEKAVILVNLGSPASSRITDVRCYLKEFLSDPSVIDLPAWIRQPLVHGLIVPLRSFRSAKRYAKLQTERGFPLLYHSRDLEDAVRVQLPADTRLFLAMRYGEPSLKNLLRSIRTRNYTELMVIPLYPQFATSTTGSIVKLLLQELDGFEIAAKTSLIMPFHTAEGFTGLWAEKISVLRPGSYDALVFSYHGIPVRQTLKGHPGHSCETMDCENSYRSANRFCYRAACFHTTRSISTRLKLENQQLITSFQSRFGRNWLSPFTVDILRKLAGEGKARVLVISPSFVADCLETTVEIGDEYKTVFMSEGGRELTLVPSLNAGPDWAGLITKLIGQPGEYAQSLDGTELPH